MAKKRIYDEPEVDSLLDEGEETEAPFEFDATAYLPVFNKERKAYDMWFLRVNTETKHVVLEIEETRYDSVQRGLKDAMERLSQDFMKWEKK